VEEQGLREFEKKLLRVCIDLQEKKGTGGWRKFQSDGFHNLNSSSNIVGIAKSRNMKWTACNNHREEDKS
jgi:hypothetical protein